MIGVNLDVQRMCVSCRSLFSYEQQASVLTLHFLIFFVTLFSSLIKSNASTIKQILNNFFNCAFLLRCLCYCNFVMDEKWLIKSIVKIITIAQRDRYIAFLRLTVKIRK